MNKNELKKKIIIGSANFDKGYGVVPAKMSQIEINKILNLSKKNNIYKIDTADGYLKNKNIFKNIDKKFKFITKIRPDYKWISLDYCEQKIENHFKKFYGNKIETLLFHDIKILFSKKGLQIFRNLENLKKKYFKKIGVSIYNTNCLNYLTLNYNLDVVQCPYNILDQRIIRSGWFAKLKDKKIETHIRSVFLQGLLVNKFAYKKQYFKKWEVHFFEWFKSLKKNNISPIDYCLNDLLNYEFDRIIIGINSYSHLKEILRFKTIKNKKKVLKFKINDLKLIDPRNWK